MKQLVLILLCLESVYCYAQEIPSQVRVASDATFAPFHYIDEAGNPTGFDIALARAALADAGIDVQVVVLPYDELFTGLTSQEHELVAATTGITPTRQKKYLFSDPYFQTCQVAVVRAGPGEPLSLVDLENRNVGASGFGTSMEAVQGMVVGAQITLDEGRGVMALQTGLVDAWIVDEFDGVAVAGASSGELRVLSEPVRLEQYGFVFDLGGRALRDSINRSLERLGADGTTSRLRREFGLERNAEWPVVGCGLPNDKGAH